MNIPILRGKELIMPGDMKSLIWGNQEDPEIYMLVVLLMELDPYLRQTELLVALEPLGPRLV